jgi:hypothetical protein
MLALPGKLRANLVTPGKFLIEAQIEPIELELASLKFDIIEAVATRNNEELLTQTRTLVDLVRSPCGKSRDCLEAADEALSDLLSAIELITDRPLQD